MPKYKLLYFDIPALGEPIRFMLSYLGEEFEDNRLQLSEWASMKSKTPFGKVPVLEVDGKTVSQSVAITRYLGKLAKLAGKDDWEDLQIDIAMDTYHDFHIEIGKYFRETDEKIKAEKREILLKETVPFYLNKFDDLVKQNNGYLANKKLSWGDIYFIATCDSISFIIGFDIFDKYENLKRLKDNVLSIPQIQKWIETRPESSLKKFFNL